MRKQSNQIIGQLLHFLLGNLPHLLQPSSSIFIHSIRTAVFVCGLVDPDFYSVFAAGAFVLKHIALLFKFFMDSHLAHLPRLKRPGFTGWPGCEKMMAIASIPPKVARFKHLLAARLRVFGQTADIEFVRMFRE